MIREDPGSRAITAFARFPARYALPPHAHSTDETIVVLKGKLILDHNGRETVLDEGSYAFIPAGQVHRFKTGRWRGCRFLVMMSGPFDFKDLSQ